MAFYAHTRELPDGALVRQTVLAHLRGTAARAAQCLKRVGLENAGYLAGLLHDMGKYSADFQQYLASGDGGRRGSVIHSFQGCRCLMERYHRADADFSAIAASELLAFAVGAHHGLFDCVDSARTVGLQYRAEKREVSYTDAVAGFLREIPPEETERLFDRARAEIGRFVGEIDGLYADDREYAFEIGLLARLLLSAVTEGDRRDTAAFMSGTSPAEPPEDLTPIWEERLAFLEKKLAQFPCDTPIAAARHTVSETCRAFAAREPGIFRLNVPTGGGKTLSSLRYALAHAARFHKRRLIFTAPLLSILEQNADVIHAFVGDDRLILEHHSNAVRTEPAANDRLDERELLVQSWDAPIIITTLVQLLNTLFDGKMTAVRRFQALCDSVIVIDEVQTVPTKMLTLFNLAIRFLSERCGATVVLCSATQPELARAEHPLREEPPQIVPYDAALWAAFRRTELRLLPNHRLDALPAQIRALMDTTDSLLVVCNKKSEAAYLLTHTESSDYRSFHLSASMCMQHRRDVLAALREALSRQERVLCIATQVIEAGVDISFGAVLRLTAGMDSIVQAAGRCNRSGESPTPRPVYAVNCTDETLGMLREIRRGKDATLLLTEAFQRAPERFGGDLFSDASIRYYYQALYREMEREEQDFYVREENATLFDLMGANEKYADGDCTGVETFFLRQAFKTAGRQFAVFDEDTADILVPYGDGRRLIAELCGERCRNDPTRRAEVLKKTSGYTVGIYSYQKKRLEQQHALISACGDCVWVLADGFYDAAVGLTDTIQTQAFTEV